MADDRADPVALARTHAAAFAGGERAWTATEFADLLGQPGILLTGDTRAFVLGRVILDEAEILTVATDPVHRRKGLARLALLDFLSAARMAGAIRVFLEVDEANTAARALYAQAGFRPCGRRRGYYRHAEGPATDALLLEMRPGPAT